VNRAGCIIAAGLMVISLAQAQEPMPIDFDETGAGGLSFDMNASFLKGATIKGGSGKVEVSSLDVAWSWSFLSLEYQGKSYNWESASEGPFFPVPEPLWNTLNTVWLTAGYSNSIDRSLQYSADVDVFASFEREHFGLVGYEVEGALFYSLPAGWRAYGGMALHYSPFQTDVYPMLGLRRGVDSEPGWAVVLGIPETKVQYRVNSRYALAAGVSVLNVDYYLLAMDNVDEHDRYLETSDNRLFLVLNVTPSKKLQVGVGLQYTVDNELMFYSENRQNLNSYRLSNVPGLLLQAQYRY